MDQEYKLIVILAALAAILVITLVGIVECHDSNQIKYYTEHGYTQVLLPGQITPTWVKGTNGY